jgi:hypothetical protein
MPMHAILPLPECPERGTEFFFASPLMDIRGFLVFLAGFFDQI